MVVPTLDAEAELPALLGALRAQTRRPDEVLVVDSSSDDGTLAALEGFPEARARVIAREDFDHGTTRHEALLETSGDYVCFMTQDALPADGRYLEELIAPLEADRSVAMASGRQLPRPGARRFEQLVRGFSYGPEPNVRGASDVGRLGIRAFLASDVCSAYRRSAYLACGGFGAAETNEDMLMAARLINAGFKVAYAAGARVYHSHDLSPREQYRRNRAVGRFLAEHADELGGVSETGEGASLAKAVLSQLLAERRPGEALAFCVDCAARLLGNRAGRWEASRGMAKSCS